MRVLSERQECDKWLTQAEGQEKRCDWADAAKGYNMLVRAHLASKNFIKAGEVQERVGLCLFRAALQAETLQDFQRLIRSSAEAFQKGVEVFRKTGDHQKEARISSCKAKAVYVKSWIERRVQNRRRLLHRCSELMKRALEEYKKLGDQHGFVRVCNDMVACLDEQIRIASNRGAARKLLEETDNLCEAALEESSTLGEEYELARAYYNAGHHFYVSVFLRPLTGETEKNREKALGYLQRAVELFEKLKEPYLSVLASLNFGRIGHSRITMEPKLGMEYLERVSRQATGIRDNYAIAWASFSLALNSWWLIRLERDPEKKMQWYHECVEYAKKAIHHSTLFSNDSGIAFACWLHAYAQHAFAEELETNPDRRRLILKEAIDISRKGVEHAERSGVLEAVHFAKHALCHSSYFFSRVETDIDKKRDALEEGLEEGEECIKAAKVAIPYDLWNLGVNECFLALILLNQAEMEPNLKRKKYLNRKASSYWVKGQESCLKYLALYPDGKRYWALGGFGFHYGESLHRLYHLTGRKDVLNELVKVYTESASMFSHVGLSNLVAEAQWQIARTLDLQKRFSDAAMYFDLASHSFRAAAEKIPLAKYWYMDEALYMLAWKEIEEAKFYSGTMDHSKSTEHYRKASTYLEESTKWRYLSPYYMALSLFELGEHLRGQNEHEEAKRTFQEAAVSFEEAKILLRSRESLAGSPEERDEILKLSRIADVKKKSCEGWATKKEAKVFRALPEHPERAAGLNSFEDAYIRARVTAPKDFAVGRATRIGLDLVNIGRKPGVLVKIEKLIPPSLSLLETSPSYTFEEGSLNMEGKLLEPLQAESLSFKVRPLGSDAVELGPRIVYVNYHGDFAVCDVEPVLIRPIITFESKLTHEIFSYFIGAFKEDHMKKQMPLEKSGWRTRTQILKGTKGIDKRHVYGVRGQLGPFILRLSNRGLIDIEIEKGKRSRGGRLMRMRIAYEKEAIKRYVATK